MPRGKERRLLYIREYREDGRLVVRAIPTPDEGSLERPLPQVLEINQKVS